MAAGHQLSTHLPTLNVPLVLTHPCFPRVTMCGYDTKRRFVVSNIAEKCAAKEDLKTLFVSAKKMLAFPGLLVIFHEVVTHPIRVVRADASGRRANGTTSKRALREAARELRISSEFRCSFFRSDTDLRGTF